LMSVSIPASITTIDDYAFYGCSSLTEVTFSPDSALTSIGNATFSQTMLTNVALPSSLTVLSNDAFDSHVQFTCVNLEVAYDTTTLCQNTQNTECLRGYRSVLGGCIPCEVGYSTVQGGDQCIAAAIVPVLADKKCRGYKSIRNILPADSVSIRYMPNTEEKMLVFSDVPPAFFNSVSTVEARFMISHHKVPDKNFANVLTRRQDYYDQRYLLAVPLHSNQTTFGLSFPSCINHSLKLGQYISKLRLIFYGVPPESMLTFDTIVGCKDYHLDPSSPFDVNDGACTTGNA
jgi:hypothetical protein